MREIPLTRGMVALVDDCDYDKVSQYRWQAGIDSKGRISARRTVNFNGSRTNLYMHRFILGVTDKSKVVDHKDRDPLNNQRSNLRICEGRQNRWNSVGNIKGSSKYKGVSWHQDSKKWHARIKVPNAKNATYLGSFLNEEDAALAYNKWAKELHGEFAALNEVPCNKKLSAING